MDEKSWYIKHKGKHVGPLSSKQLKHLASSNQIEVDTPVSMDRVEWSSAGKVKGLFTAVAIRPTQIVPAATNVEQSIAYSPTVPNKIVIVEQQAIATTKECPFCSEPIAINAMKCKHCGEFLDAALRQASRPQAIQPQPVFQQVVAAAPAPSIVIQNHISNVVNSHRIQSWNPLVAGFLSLIIPGLGQLYKGQFFNGIAWFVVTIVGYVAFIIPGLVLHLCCIAGAMTGRSR